MFTIQAFDSKKQDSYVQLENVAFLVGNGINRHKGNNFTWVELISESFPDQYKIYFSHQFSESKKGIQNTIDNYLDGLSYPEMAELALRLREDENKKSEDEIRNKQEEKIANDDKKNVKKKENAVLAYKNIIAELTKEKMPKFQNEKHEKVIEFAEKYNIPILTTNYDTSLLTTKYLNLLENQKNKIFWMKNNGDKDKYDRIFLTNAYFSKGRMDYDDVRERFAVWYIHGLAMEKSYYGSIRITNKDYADAISNLKTYINKDLYNDDDKWKGWNTWVNIIMHNDLIIAGLGLEQSETDLRWLLVERYIYHTKKEREAIELRKKYRRPETIFVYSDEMKNGTKLYFEALGVKFVKKSYDEVFDFEKYIIRK